MRSDHVQDGDVAGEEWLTNMASIGPLPFLMSTARMVLGGEDDMARGRVCKAML